MPVLGLFLILLLTACSAAPPPSYPTAPGAYATATGEPDPAELRWLSGFSVVEAGDLWDGPDPAYAALLQEGVRLLGYDWMPAAYHEPDGEDFPLAAWLYKNRAWASLNPDGPFPHCRAMGYAWCEDYYFDYGEDRVIARKVRALVEAAGRWRGIFFDWGAGVFLEEEAYDAMRETFQKRHPGTDYRQAVGRFYAALAREAPGTIVSNQGFRNAEAVLPHVHLDMTESYAVGEEYLGRRLRVRGRGEVEVPDTLYYPVSTDFRRGRLEDTLEWLKELDSIGHKFGGPHFGGFIYMNYAAPKFVPEGDGTYRAEVPRNAILFGYAVPKLRGHTGYTEVPLDRRLERLPVYQADLGRPLGEDFEFQDGVYVRFYERGLVLVGELEGPRKVRLGSPFMRAGRLYDFYAERWLAASEGRLVLELEPERDPVTGGFAPVGRVLVYAR